MRRPVRWASPSRAKRSLRGASVTLLLGPTLLEPPAGVDVVRVTTARELYDAAMQHAAGADLAIATAAVADWRPQSPSDSKMKKTDADLTVQMVRNPDVLAALGERKGRSFLVGFAAETDDHERTRAKNSPANTSTQLPSTTFGANAVLGPSKTRSRCCGGSDARRDLGTARKAELAARLLDAVEELMECS